MRPLRQHWATVAGNCAQHCHLPPLVHYLPVSAQWRVKVVVCVRCGLHDNLAWLATLTPGTSHCLLSSCPAGRWRMLSLTRFMKTAAPDHAADLTRYTLSICPVMKLQRRSFLRLPVLVLNMCACVYLLASIAIRILSPAPSRFIMSSNCPGGERWGVIWSGTTQSIDGMTNWTSADTSIRLQPTAL